MKGLSIGTRAGGLVVAVVLATLSTFALITYVRGAENRAFQGAETVEVYVAREEIPAGTSADAAVQRAAIERTTVPRKVVAAGAITSLEEIRGKAAAVAILPGEQILGARFVAPTEATGLAIPAGRQAMSVEVDTPPGVAGFAQPGARVSVIAHVSVPVRGGGTEPRAQYLLQDVPVLAVGRSLASTSAPAGDRAAEREDRTVTDRVLLTLAVTTSQAERLAYAIFEGDIYFTLLPPDQKPAKTSGRTRNTIFR